MQQLRQRQGYRQYQECVEFHMLCLEAHSLCFGLCFGMSLEETLIECSKNEIIFKIVFMHKSASILAAGNSRRMKHLTRDVPKSMLKVGTKRVIEYHLDNLYRNQVSEIVIVLVLSNSD